MIDFKQVDILFGKDTRAALAKSQLLLPMYAYLLAWFFFYCYPIARFSMYLESRVAIR